MVDINLRVAGGVSRIHSLNPHYKPSLLTMVVNHQSMIGFGRLQPFQSVRDAGCGCCSHAEEAPLVAVQDTATDHYTLLMGE